MKPVNPVTQAKRERLACPQVDAEQVAEAPQDALDLIVDSHDIEPQQILGRLALWLVEDPVRLVCATFQLALWHDPNQPVSWLEDAVRTVALPRPEAAA